jgi:hypothetical protein
MAGMSADSLTDLGGSEWSERWMGVWSIWVNSRMLTGEIFSVPTGKRLFLFIFVLLSIIQNRSFDPDAFVDCCIDTDLFGTTDRRTMQMLCDFFYCKP